MSEIYYYSPQLEDNNYLADGLDLIYFINKSHKIKHLLNNINNIDNIDNHILIKKFDENNYLTKNNFPYLIPLLCNHYIFWTFDNKTHKDVLEYLTNLNMININTEYIICLNNRNNIKILSLEQVDILKNFEQSIKQYEILIRPKIFNSTNNIYSTKNIYLTNNINSNIVSNQKKRVLRKIIIVARHGPREPIYLLNNLDPFLHSSTSTNTSTNTSTKINVKDAKLTNQGLKYCYNYGKYIRKIFAIDFFNFDIKKSIAISTNINRTINSAIQFMNGLFDKTTFNESNIILSNDLIGDISMTSEDKKEYEEYHNNMTLLSVNSSVSGKVELFESKANLNKKIYDILGVKINGVKDYFNIHSTIEVYKFHNQSIPNEWTKELNDQLTTCAEEYYYKLFYKTKFCNMFTDLLLNKINELILDKNINFAYLSSHDVVIYPLAIRIFGQEIHLPYFCSSIRFEIWDEEMRIYYDDILIYNKLL